MYKAHVKQNKNDVLSKRNQESCAVAMPASQPS